MLFKAVVLDLDGVLYRGENPIPGAREAVSKLRSLGLKVYFLTNNSTKTRADYVQKLSRMGIPAKEREVYTSALAAAHFLKERYKKGVAFVIGERGLKSELKASGFRIARSANEKIDFVVVGLDRSLTYEKLAHAQRAIREQNALFLATNADPTLPVEKGELPGSAAMVSAVSACTGRKPAFTFGKPNTFLLECILADAGCTPSELLVIGDRLATDIAVANKIGAYSVLVLTGATSKSQARNAKGILKPKKIINSIAEIGKVLC
jgi:4-nitrophenyl phosphatase